MGQICLGPPSIAISPLFPLGVVLKKMIHPAIGNKQAARSTQLNGDLMR
jgi:hypothetical protein